ncbi:MAG: tripartite tricarboxylate transporter substrate binding protein [Betaproteobacteria bacterium]|nr:tripartite tricarboxylate transporter substrate binding protein [Betaproteobacteria bacterium]
MIFSLRVYFCSVLAAACALLAAFAGAASYPERPIRLIVPLAANGAMDTVARSLAIRLSESLGQTVVVDNRGGGGGSVGAELVRFAAPDGYTIMMISASSVVHPLMYKAEYDAVRDFAPITQLTSQPHLIVVNPSVPAKSLVELIAYAKANPNKLNYASAGNGSLIHLTGELFKFATGTEMTHIPYKGIGAAYPDLIGGQIQLTFGSIISALPQVRAGRLRGLAVTGAKRAKPLPDVPSASEVGVKGFVMTQWYGALAPAKTPQPIIDRLNAEMRKAIDNPAVLSRLIDDGAEAVPGTPQQFRDHLIAERSKWAGVIKQAKIKGD